MQKGLNKLTEREKCELGMLYDANYSEETVKLRLKCQELCYDFNQIRPSDLSPVITAPFHCDNGFNIELGDYFYANYNLIILDGAKVTVGDHVFIAPNCCISTAGHPLDAKRRNQGLEYAFPVTIGSNVWIGANVCILPGVTIGEGAVIGAGSVVNKDIPPYTVAVGNPCKVLRKITDNDILKYS